MNRIEILEKALELTRGDRNKAYGPPEPNLRCFAHLVDDYLCGLGWPGQDKDMVLDAVDGSVIMALAKISRIAVNKQHADNYVGGSAYLAIAGECAETQNVKTFIVSTDKGFADFEEREKTEEAKTADDGFPSASCTTEKTPVPSFSQIVDEAFPAPGKEANTCPVCTRPSDMKEGFACRQCGGYPERRGIELPDNAIINCRHCGGLMGAHTASCRRNEVGG